MKNIFERCVSFCEIKPFKKGFTLSEMLVVVLVIGVLAAIALPSYTKSVKKSRVSDALSNLEIVSAKQQDYLINNERYATTFKELNVPVSGLNEDSNTATIGNFTYTLSDDGGCITATYTGGDSYTIGRNTNNEVRCTGGKCDFISDLVEAGDLENCSYDGGGDEGGAIACTLTCVKHCDYGPDIYGTCVLNGNSQSCSYSSECATEGEKQSFDCENNVKNGETTTSDGCVYTCQNGTLTRTGVASGYAWNEGQGKCLQMMCKEGKVQKNTVDGVHYCRTYTKGEWVPSGWTQPC